MKQIILTLVVSLALTIILEEAAAMISGVRKCFDLAVILFTNTLTNPVVVFAGLLLANFTQIPRVIYVTVLELIVFVTEALIFKKLLYAEKPSPFILSLILNGVSFVIGTPLANKIIELLL